MDKMKELELVKNLAEIRVTRRGLLVGAGVVAGGITAGLSVADAISTGARAAALNKRTYAPIISRYGSLNPEGILTTPTRIPEPNPTPTVPPTTEGEPTLSPAEHYSRLQLVESESINGVAVSIRKTSNAQLWADLYDPLKQELARLIAQNSAGLGSNAFTSAEGVFVKDSGDSPTGVFMGGFYVRNQNDGATFAGIIGGTRLGSKIIVYYALELGLDQSDRTLVSNRNWSLGIDIVRFSKDGISPHNQIALTQEEISFLDQEPIRTS